MINVTIENFDAEVHERLRVHKEAAKQSLDAQQQMLLDLAKFALADRASNGDGSGWQRQCPL